MNFDVCSKRQETVMKALLLQEGKKKFEKQTAKFCMSQERYLNLSTKKQDTVLKEVSTDRQACSIVQGRYYEVWRLQLTGCYQNSSVSFF